MFSSSTEPCLHLVRNTQSTQLAHTREGAFQVTPIQFRNHYFLSSVYLPLQRFNTSSKDPFLITPPPPRPPPIPFKDEFQVKKVQYRCNSTQPQLSSILTLPSATSVVDCFGSFFNFRHYIRFNMFVWCVFCIYFLSVNIWYSLKNTNVQNKTS